ncbi:MAG: TlpA family protein disulfide reductase [Marinifilaceae bacterium]
MKQLFMVLLLAISAISNAQNVDDRGYKVKVGDKAPNIQLEYLDGTTVPLKKLKGKVIMLQFTASWCGVCRKEMPVIEQEIWEKYKDRKDFVLVGIDLKEKKETVAKFQKQTGITYPLTLDPNGDYFYSFANEGAGVTRNVIIDRNGKIIYLTRLFERGEFNEMKDVIAKALKK